ncbi:hypothetical protein [Micromonospora sediminicola]|uniref:hypothetical protein n=1 Tax=Micromonospora sediminicola TaxID=946078 RepID=UPI003788EC17
MPEAVDTVDRRVPARPGRRRWWPLWIVLIAVGLLGALRLTGPAETPAQRYVSRVDVRGYERVHDYLDPGTAPAVDRAAVTLFVGPPEDDVLTRVSGPGLVLTAASGDPGPDVRVVGRGR